MLSSILPFPEILAMLSEMNFAELLYDCELLYGCENSHDCFRLVNCSRLIFINQVTVTLIDKLTLQLYHDIVVYRGGLKKRKNKFEK